jgi:hypothetical protein
MTYIKSVNFMDFYKKNSVIYSLGLFNKHLLNYFQNADYQFT